MFPTVYRCNSVWKVRSQFRRHGFEGIAYGYDAEPSYLQFSSVAYAFGLLIQKFTPRCFRGSIFAFAKLIEEPAPAADDR